MSQLWIKSNRSLSITSGGLLDDYEEYYDEFNKKSPIECYKLRMIGFYCLTLFLVSFVFNYILLKIFYIYSELRTPSNVFFIVLTILNLIGTLFQLPIVILSNFYCQWIFSKTGCYFSAFIMFFIGCSSIYLYAAISFQKLYSIYHPVDLKNVKLAPYFVVVFTCILIGLFWSSMPLIGWSNYTLEGAYTSCSIDWRSTEPNSFSFNVLIFSFVYAGNMSPFP